MFRALHWVPVLLACAVLTWCQSQAGAHAGPASWLQAAMLQGVVSAPAVSVVAQAPCTDASVSMRPAAARPTAWALGPVPAVPDAMPSALMDMEHEQPDGALPSPLLDCSLALPVAQPLYSPISTYVAPRRGLARPPDLG